MVQQAPSYQIPKKNIKEILTSLGLKHSDIINGLVPTIVDTGNLFLNIPVKNENILKQIEPQLDKIKQLSEQFNLIGYYVFTNNVDD